MESKERVDLIRKGNQLFNNGQIDKAVEIFTKTSYKDGLTRAGDYFFYDKRMPLIAFRYYKLADRKDRINEIFQRMILALSKWVRGEDASEPSALRVELPPLKVSPKLKILAEEILRKGEQQKNKKGDGI